MNFQFQTDGKLSQNIHFINTTKIISSSKYLLRNQYYLTKKKKYVILNSSTLCRFQYKSILRIPMWIVLDINEKKNSSQVYCGVKLKKTTKSS